jgi:hypothetical protein
MKKKRIGMKDALYTLKFKHIFRVMKLTSISLLLGISFVFATHADSQTAYVSILANNMQIKEIINQIERQTPYLSSIILLLLA